MTPEMYSFFVDGPITAWARTGYNSRTKQRFTPKKQASYRELIQSIARGKIPQPIDGPVHLDIIAKFQVAPSWSHQKKQDHYGQPHTQKPDIDNVEKMVMDALNGIAWQDDKQVAFSVADKIWSSRAGLYVIVKPYGETWASVSESSQKTLDEIFELRCKPQLDLFEGAG